MQYSSKMLSSRINFYMISDIVGASQMNFILKQYRVGLGYGRNFLWRVHSRQTVLEDQMLAI